MTTESIFNDIGNEGYFQVLLISLTTFASVPSTMTHIILPFLLVTPPWSCQKNAPSLGNGTRKMERHREGNGTEAIWQTCGENKADCHHYFEPGVQTIVTEWDLVCDRKWLASLSVSVQMAGFFTGALVVSWLADRLGKKTMLMLAFLIHTVFNAAAALAWSPLAFLWFGYFVGVSFGSVRTLAIPFMLEFVSTRWRSVPAAIPLIPGTRLVLSACWIFCPRWRIYYIISAVTMIPAMIAFYLLPESLRWLAVKGKVEEVQKLVKRISRINGTTHQVSDNYYTDTVKEIESKAVEAKTNVRWCCQVLAQIYSDKMLVFVTVRLQFLWLCIGLVTNGIVIRMPQIFDQISIAMVMVAVLDVLASIVAPFIANRLGRRIGMTVALLAGAGAGLLGIAFHAWSLPGSHVVLSCVCLAMKCWSTMANVLLTVYAAEVFPTSIRSFSFGWCYSYSRLGAVIAPFLVDLDAFLMTSLVLLVTLLVLTSCVTFSLTETKDCILKDSGTVCYGSMEAEISVKDNRQHHSEAVNKSSEDE